MEPREIPGCSALFKSQFRAQVQGHRWADSWGAPMWRNGLELELIAWWVSPLPELLAGRDCAYLATEISQTTLYVITYSFLQSSPTVSPCGLGWPSVDRVDGWEPCFFCRSCLLLLLDRSQGSNSFSLKGCPLLHANPCLERMVAVELTALLVLQAVLKHCRVGIIHNDNNI